MKKEDLIVSLLKSKESIAELFNDKEGLLGFLASRITFKLNNY